MSGWYDLDDRGFALMLHTLSDADTRWDLQPEPVHIDYNPDAPIWKYGRLTHVAAEYASGPQPWPEPGAHIVHPDGRRQFVPSYAPGSPRFDAMLARAGAALDSLATPGDDGHCKRCSTDDGLHEHWCHVLTQLGDPPMVDVCDGCEGRGCSRCTDDDGLPL